MTGETHRLMRTTQHGMRAGREHMLNKTDPNDSRERTGDESERQG